MRARFACCRRGRCGSGAGRVLNIPAGDVLVAAAWAANGMQRSSRVVRGGVRRVATAVKIGSIGRAVQIRLPAGVDHIENRMARWSFVGIALPTFAALFLQAPLMGER